MTQEVDAGRESGGPNRVRPVTGLLLPGLKRWRIRRGLTQQQLADRVGARLQYVSRVEQGKRGCNRVVAQKMAEVLDVDLDELRADSGGRDPGTRYLHKAYFKILLERVVGSSYLVLEEGELEERVEGHSAEELSATNRS